MWTCQRWLAPCKAKRGGASSAEWYRPGDEMVWYYPASCRSLVCGDYLRCLLLAHELCSNIPHIPHGRPESHYQCILQGGQIPEAKTLAIADQLCSDLVASEPAASSDRKRKSGHIDELIGPVEEPIELEAERGRLMLEGWEEGSVQASSGEEEFIPHEMVASSSSASAVPPPPVALVVRAKAKARVNHPGYPINIRGGDDGAHLRHDTQKHILSAHCAHPSHGRMCRINRSLKGNARKPSQGRPLGLLVAWINCAGAFTAHPSPKENMKAHIKAAQWPEVLLEDHLSFANRAAARAWVADNSADWAELSDLERDQNAGEEVEPTDPP